jgi:predicted dehydrogenase
MDLTPEQIAIGRRNFLKALAGVPPLAALGAAAALRGPIKGGPIKAGLIGPGSQGKVLLGQCGKEFIDLRAVCDINPQRRQEASESLVKMGLPAPRLYEDWAEMLAKEDIEAVIIATPLWTHADMTVGCLDAGKHVLVEKMMAYDVEGCRRMADAANRHRLVLEIGYNRFYAAKYQTAYQAVIRPGLLGDIYHVRLMYHRARSWRRDTPPPSPDYSPARWGYPTWDHLANWRLYRKYSQGLVAELGGHQIGTANLFLGSSPTAALGSGGIYRFKDREVNDHVFVTLEYPQGRTVTFSSIESNDFDHITEVFMGTKGTLIVEYEGEVLLYGAKGDSIDIPDTEGPTVGKGPAVNRRTTIEVAPKTADAVLEASESRLADAAGGTTGGPGRRIGSDGGDDGLLPYRLEIATFCAAIRTGAPLQCGVDMAFKTTVACLAANEAMDKKVRISVPSLA